MDIHEYQAKALLARFGVSIPAGRLASSAAQAEAAAKALPGPRWVVKAQIHAGDRFAAGGVRLADSAEAVKAAAAAMLGGRLVTEQTGAGGIQVRRVYVESACEIARELYAGILVDRAEGEVVLLASAAGGEAIEEAAKRAPEAIHRLPIDLSSGLDRVAGARLAAALSPDEALAEPTLEVLAAMTKAFIELDASLIEINPLVVTPSGELMALDAKMSLDDNALGRHGDLEALREEDEADPEHLERERHGFNYIRFAGDIGCVVTGAGLALATMDLIKLHGGEPANFLDLPPVADRMAIAAATRRVLADPRVKVLLVNAVGGGMTRCDVIAEGISTAVREVGLSVPLIVRFAGTNKDRGLLLLKNARFPVRSFASMEEAVSAALAAARGR